MFRSGGVRPDSFSAAPPCATAGEASIATSGIRQKYDLEVERIEARLDGLATATRIVAVTDLHYGPYAGGDRVVHWVDAISAAERDLFVLGGRVVDHRARQPDARRPVASSSRASTTFVTGNPTSIAAWWERPHGAPALLVSHNPDLVPSVPRAVDLTFAGTRTAARSASHASVPWSPPRPTVAASPQAGSTRWRAYVLRGPGVATCPLRWNHPPKLRLLTLLSTTAS